MNDSSHSRAGPPRLAATVAHAAPAPSAPSPILCVDLDGTLLRTDSLHESVLNASRHRPLALLRAIARLPAGKAAFKRRVAELSRVDPATLPYDPDVLTFLREQHAQGRRIALVSAADQELVAAIAEHLGVFVHALGSDGVTNLAGANKLAAIRSLFGENFSYIGNHRVDLPIWEQARTVLLAGDDAGLLRRAAPGGRLESDLRRRPPGLRPWLRAMRLHQWAKNGLVFAPVVLAAPYLTAGDVGRAVVGFFVFGLLASVGYIVNDLLDLPADRRHPTKRFRPFAAGVLTAKAGVATATAMLLFASGLAGLLNGPFLAVATAYFLGTVAYSLQLKRMPMLDVVVLASLFTLRVAGGAALLTVPFSYWLITFSMFVFLSLALLKRYVELRDEAVDAAVTRDSRGYSPEDLSLLLPFGCGSAVAASIIVVIYVVEERFPDAAYSRPEMLWFVFPLLLLWLMHMWRTAVQGSMHEDPVFFAIKDRVSVLLGVAVVACLALAW
jgi:4-hydroxybenzoate polyprenyltransferase